MHITAAISFFILFYLRLTRKLNQILELIIHYAINSDTRDFILSIRDIYALFNAARMLLKLLARNTIYETIAALLLIKQIVSFQAKKFPSDSVGFCSNAKNFAGRKQRDQSSNVCTKPQYLQYFAACARFGYSTRYGQVQVRVRSGLHCIQVTFKQHLSQGYICRQVTNKFVTVRLPQDKHYAYFDKKYTHILSFIEQL